MDAFDAKFALSLFQLRKESLMKEWKIMQSRRTIVTLASVITKTNSEELTANISSSALGRVNVNMYSFSTFGSTLSRCKIYKENFKQEFIDARRNIDNLIIKESYLFEKEFHSFSMLCIDVILSGQNIVKAFGECYLCSIT